jgi:hypothetical protein
MQQEAAADHPGGGSKGAIEPGRHHVR